jgi:hypothetical protein
MNVWRRKKDDPADYERKDARFKAREIWGYTPWYFDLAPDGREDAFDLLGDPKCFYGKYGLTTADRSSPEYGIFYTAEDWNKWLARRSLPSNHKKAHECLWNGPVWPPSPSPSR